MSTTIENTSETVLPEHYEVVNGQIVEISPMSAFASEIANRLRDHFAVYVVQKNNGRARMDMMFHIPIPEDSELTREPDLAFISFGRWPQDRSLPYRGNPVDVVPNLVLEVASPNDDAEELLAKAHEYLRAGVELVWVVFPRVRQLYAYTSTTAAPKLYTELDSLDGGTVLPDFLVPMAGLFPAMLVEPETENEG